MAKLGFTEEIVQPKYRFKLTRFNDVMLSTTASYLIKDIILADCFVILWGSPKSGKSFLGFDMAMHVALGREYRGHRVRQGSVVYCALEGGQGFRKRIDEHDSLRSGDPCPNRPRSFLTARSFFGLP